MPSRHEIRESFQRAVEAADPRLNVFQGKLIESLHDVEPCALILMAGAEVSQNNLKFGRWWTATMLMAVYIDSANGDEAVDYIVDKVIPCVDEKVRMDFPTMTVTFQSIEYDRETDPALSGATLAWELQYSG